MSITRISRRNFLAAPAFVFGHCAMPSPGLAVASPAVHSFRNLEALARSIGGRLILPDETGFVSAALPRNMRYAETFPCAIAICVSVADVQAAVRWARDQNVPFAIRSGGHNYAGFSTTTGLLIDIKPLQSTALDLRNGTITVGGGVNNRNLVDALTGKSFYVPCGRCWSVGVAGLTLGGGWGLSSGRSGLTCDSLSSTEVITANGETITANAGGSHSDLFWAMRGGGGGNFGVNTSLTFRLSDISTPVTTFKITWSAATFVDLVVSLQDIQSSNARRMGSKISVGQKASGPIRGLDDLQITFLGQYFGSKRRLEKILGAIIASQPPHQMLIRELDFWQSTESLNDQGAPNIFYVRSAYVGASLAADGLHRMLENLLRWPGSANAQQGLGTLLSLGGRVNDFSSDATAYFHRNASSIFRVDIVGSTLDTNDLIARQQDWQRNYMSDMKDYLLPQSYVNFPVRDLNGWAKAYYGENIARLQQIKAKYDPENVFRFLQSIQG